MPDDYDHFAEALGEYLQEAYRRGFLDGEDNAEGDEPTRHFDDMAGKRAADHLRRLL